MGLTMIFTLQLICLALTPAVKKQVTAIIGIGGNDLTGATRFLLGILPLLWIVLVVGIMTTGILVCINYDADTPKS